MCSIIKNRFKHAQRRLFERYGTTLDKTMHMRLIKNFRNNIDIISAKEQSNTKTDVMIKMDNKYYRFIYDKQYGSIITFLPFEDENEAFSLKNNFYNYNY